MALPSILVLKLSIRHQSCTDSFLFRRKTLNVVVREFRVNWLFCTDGWWCFNVSLLKQWLSYHSCMNLLLTDPRFSAAVFPSCWCEREEEEEGWEWVRIGGAAPVCLVQQQQCQGRLSNMFKITAALHRHCSSTPRVGTIQTQTCFICFLK